MDGSEVTIRHEHSRFEIVVDGAVAGFTDYLVDGERRIFFHTSVDDRYQGRGLAGQVVSAALSETREDGMRAVAVCPYVARYLERHPEFADVADAVTPADQAKVRGADDA